MKNLDPNRPISRQRRWQLAHLEQGLCAKCSEPRVDGTEYCAAHRQYLRKFSHERGHPYREKRAAPLLMPVNRLVVRLTHG